MVARDLYLRKATRRDCQVKKRNVDATQKQAGRN